METHYRAAFQSYLPDRDVLDLTHKQYVCVKVQMKFGTDEQSQTLKLADRVPSSLALLHLGFLAVLMRAPALPQGMSQCTDFVA